jgi:HK97 family phage portal protein
MWPFNRAEKRSAQVTQSAERFYEALGLSLYGLPGDATVSTDVAMGVPSVWAAINFISGTIAGLPLNVYDRKSDGTKARVKPTAANQIVTMLHDAVNDDYSSFQWRFDMFTTGVLKHGRFVTYIERDTSGRPINLFPLPKCEVSRGADGRKKYKHTSGGRTVLYDQAEVLDITFLLDDDLLQHVSPLKRCAVAIGKAYYANEFGSKLFKNGGLPAFALEGPFGSEKSASRASENVSEATKKAAQKGGNVLALPIGHTLKPLGSDADKMQLVEGQRFAIEEVARIYSLPPTFLQDLTHGTFSNTEQQDLHFVKHTLKRWIEQLEQEMNLKFFGRGSKRFVEFNVDGLLRGDYKTRMDGNAQAIQTGQLTPNEARAMENREPLDGGNKLYIQGATVPLATQSQEPTDGS